MPSSSHPAVVVAAAASVAAGLIHAAAAGSHAELATLSVLFSLTALAQIGWGVAALLRPSPPVVMAGVGIHLATLGGWLASRTVGISAIEGLGTGQGLGFQDGLAVGLEAVAVLGAVLGLTTVALPRLAGAAVPAVVAALAFATVPAMAQPHDHGAHDHDAAHDEHHETEDEEHHEAEDDKPTDEVATPTAEELGYDPSFVRFLDKAATPEARDRAERLIIGTTEAMEAFPDEAAIQAAGFISIGDGRTGYEHYINVQRIVDPRVLDPADIESIVLTVDPDGTKQVASAMYLLPFGTTMADAPDVAGGLTPWHDHQNLCWEGAKVVGTTDADGTCARGVFRATQPMLHVWVTEHPCGPFAGIEGAHGSGCDDHDH